MVCPDSRTGIKAYDELNKWFKGEIQKLNSVSNDKIGRDIIKFHGEMSQPELQTLGHYADIFMVTSDVDGLHLGPVEWLTTRNYHNNDRLANLILSRGAGVSEYFPHAMIFHPGNYKQLITLLRQTTTEPSVDKATRSEMIKHDFQEDAKGFNLVIWQTNAAIGLVARHERDKPEVRYYEQRTVSIGYGTFDSRFFRRKPDHQRSSHAKGHYGSMDTTATNLKSKL
jgi:hypothetical protein